MARTALIPEGSGLAFVSPYSPGLVQALKDEIPSESRRWDAAGKRWIVDARYGATCVQLAAKYLGVSIEAPATEAAKAEVRLVKVEYLGRCKPRQYLTSPTAFGWVDGAWSLIIPESVLRAWFEATPARPGERPTLYAVLGIRAEATTEEVRSAYRRLARQWHPDVSREPDSAEQFKVILNAYEILGDSLTRRKYDAGLAFESSIVNQRQTGSERLADIVAWQGLDGYRAPLRCGYVLVEGERTVKGFQVSRIVQWEDIVDSRGRVMVDWGAGDDTFTVVWQ